MYSTYIFVTFLSIFILTALAALGDLVGLLNIKDPSSRKWLRTGLLAEVVAVVIAMASLVLIKRDAEVWTIYGKISLNQVVDNASPKQAIFSVAPPTVEIDENGRFEASVVIRKKSDGTWDYPKVQIAVPGYSSKTVHFDDVWIGIGETNMLPCDKDEDKKVIMMKSPVVLEVLQRAYMPEMGEELHMMIMDEAPELGGEEL